MSSGRIEENGGVILLHSALFARALNTRVCVSTCARVMSFLRRESLCWRFFAAATLSGLINIFSTRRGFFSKFGGFGTGEKIV